MPDTLIGCSLLNNLNVSYNKFCVFPIVLTKLQEIEIINLSSNQIEIIPEEVFFLINLKKKFFFRLKI